MVYIRGLTLLSRYLEAFGEADVPKDFVGLTVGDVTGEASGDIEGETTGDTMGDVEALGEADPAGGPHEARAKTATIIRTIIARINTFFIKITSFYDVCPKNRQSMHKLEWKILDGPITTLVHCHLASPAKSVLICQGKTD